MEPIQASAELTKRDRSYKWAEACLRRAMASHNLRRAVRAATLMQALCARMDDLRRPRHAFPGLRM